MLNKIEIYGNICNDLELKQLPNGNSSCKFSIACKRNYKNKDGNYDTDFFDVSTFGAQAELVSRNFTKGKPILLVGSIETRTFQDRAGNNRKVVEIKANEIHFVGGKESNAGSGEYVPASYNAGNAPVFEPVADDGDLPF